MAMVTPHTDRNCIQCIAAAKGNTEFTCEMLTKKKRPIVGAGVFCEAYCVHHFKTGPSLSKRILFS